MDIFNILRENTDDVILILNYFIEAGDQCDSAPAAAPAPAGKRGRDEFWDYV